MTFTTWCAGGVGSGGPAAAEAQLQSRGAGTEGRLPEEVEKGRKGTGRPLEQGQSGEEDLQRSGKE